MNVAVVDVGSNTIRLLVAARGGDGLVGVARGKRVVGLGADIERTARSRRRSSPRRSECVAGFADIARAPAPR